MNDYEDIYKKEGYNLIGGIDEVGRGPLVGPVVAACVILPNDFELMGLTDSKKLSEKKRNLYYDIIIKKAVSVGIGLVDNEEIDKINIYQATKKAMIIAINECDVKPDFLLIDGNMKFELNNYLSIIKGDSKSISIAAASVVAKVVRDKMMYDLDIIYPMYDFKSNKGYPTRKHIKAINEYGIINEHRKSYKPVTDYINKGV